MCSTCPLGQGWFGQAMFHFGGFANHVEPRRSRKDGFSVSRLLSELDAVVCQDHVDLVRHSFQEEFKEFPGCIEVGLLNQLCDGKLISAVVSHKEKELAFFVSDSGNIPFSCMQPCAAGQCMKKKPIG